MKTTYDEMNDEMRRMLDDGSEVILYDWSNALSPHGLAVAGLVRRGLWSVKRRHIADEPMSRYTVYGPVEQDT